MACRMPPQSSSHRTGSARLTQPTNQRQQVSQGQASERPILTYEPRLLIGQPSVVQGQLESSRSAQGQPEWCRIWVGLLAKEIQGVPMPGPLALAIVS